MSTLGTLRSPGGGAQDATGAGPCSLAFALVRESHRSPNGTHLFLQRQQAQSRNSVLEFLFLPGGTRAPLRVHPDPGRGLQSLWQRGPRSRCGGRILALGIQETPVRAGRVLGRAPGGEAGFPGSCGRRTR